MSIQPLEAPVIQEMPALESAKEKAIEAARIVDGMKARNILILQVSRVCNFTDFLVIATCGSSLQLRGAGHRVERGLREQGVRPIATAGYDTASWVVLDYGDVVVHLFSEESRSYYGLEKLWADAAPVEWSPVPIPIRAS